jgi:hypothetical protein
MPHQQLNGAHIGSVFQHVCGKGVAQRLSTLLIICVLRAFTTVITLSSIMPLKS